MSAELLRETARLMREQHDLRHVRHEFWNRLADWLADVAVDLDEDLWPDGHDVPRNALVVARAYLGAAS